MSREYPDWVNPWKAAEGNRVFSGTIPLARMQRLAPCLAGVEGEASFTARFGLDSQRRVMVDVEVTAVLVLVCQVTLETFPYPVNRRSRLAVVASEGEQQGLPDDYEATCTENGRLAFERLVEDELLLSLPQVPRKPGLQAVDFSTGGSDNTSVAQPETYKPFAGLGDLLHGRQAKQETGKD